MTSITVKASNLRPGDTLLDPELGTPVYEIDHRMRAVRSTGDLKFLVADLEAHTYREIQLRPGVTINIVRA